MPGIILDIGTGDGKFAYRIAKSHPDRLIIGIDPNQKKLIKYSSKIYKKSSKGGLENIFFILSDIENLPQELNGIANQIFINFPWGSLLSGIVNAQDSVWNSIRRVSKKGTIIDIILGYDKKHERKEIERMKLPELSSGYIKDTLIPRLKTGGFEMLEYKTLSDSDIKKYPSSWAKKLGFGREREYHFLRLKRI